MIPRLMFSEILISPADTVPVKTIPKSVREMLSHSGSVS